jgi:hypothetical protein
VLGRHACVQRRQRVAGRVIQNRMFSRALLVLLLVLNVGVAAWWLLRPEAVPVAEVLAPVAPRLQLVGETTAARTSAPASGDATPLAASPTPASTPAMAPAAATSTSTMAPDAGTIAATRCVRLGPFASEEALAHAQTALQPLVARMAVATVPASGRGWRVWLPPLADREAAQATATRIGAAGFTDYYVVPDGTEANSIALGRYGNQASAQRRQAQLQAAGFAARAEALGAVTRWIDVTSTMDEAALRAGSGAAQSRALDCASLH